MGWPEYTYLALIAVGLGSAVANHGKPHAPMDAWAYLIGTVVAVFLMYHGGFFQ